MRLQIVGLPASSGPRLSQLAVPLPAGARFQTMLLLAVPVVAMGLASAGFARWLGVAFAATWIVLDVVAVWNRWVALVLPVVAAAFFVLTLVALPFNSPPSIVDYWTAVALTYLALPDWKG
jgi:hypothetical protein